MRFANREITNSLTDSYVDHAYISKIINASYGKYEEYKEVY